jgi:hypothetical protein
MPNVDPRSDGSREIHSVAKNVPQQLQANAASATCSNTNVGKVRTADLKVGNDERQVWVSI